MQTFLNFGNFRLINYIIDECIRNFVESECLSR